MDTNNSNHVTPPPQAAELVIRGHDKAVAFACPQCGHLFVLTKREQEDTRLREAKRLEAAFHCAKKHCEKCNAALSWFWKRFCSDCQEAEAFEKAKKVSIESYPDQPVYWEGGSGNMGDHYFNSVEDVLDYCEENELEIPKYVWGCERMVFKLSADNIVEHALSDFYENAFDRISHKSMKTLQEFLDVWAKEQNIDGWEVTHAVAVLLKEADDAAA